MMRSEHGVPLTFRRLGGLNLVYPQNQTSQTLDEHLGTPEVIEGTGRNLMSIHYRSSDERTGPEEDEKFIPIAEALTEPARGGVPM